MQLKNTCSNKGAIYVSKFFSSEAALLDERDIHTILEEVREVRILIFVFNRPLWRETVDMDHDLLKVHERVFWEHE